MRGDRPILVLTASTGAGHNMAAHAVAAALAARAPAERIEVHDVLASAGGFFRTVYGGGYRALVRYFPTGMGWLYDATDRPNCRASDFLRRAVQRICTPPLARFIISKNPKLVINTHYLPAEIVADLRTRGKLDCPQVTVTTDFETHRIWIHSPAERYYAATERSRTQLAAWGVTPDRILVTGIPVRPGFAQLPDRGAIRARLGLDRDRPVILLLAGVVGYGSPERILQELANTRTNAQIVAITGHNEALRRRMLACTRGVSTSVTIVGFTDRVHEWMSAADLMVSKAGGLTSSEALACGLPIVIVNPIPGQETHNSDYLIQHGAAIRVDSPALVGDHVSRLLGDPARLRKMRESARQIARPDAADHIAADVLELLGVPGGSIRVQAPREMPPSQRTRQPQHEDAVGGGVRCDI